MHWSLNALLKWSLTILIVKKNREKFFLTLYGWRLKKVTFLFLFYFSC